MKVTADQLMNMLRATLYLRYNAGMYLVNAITTTTQEANEHMTASDADALLISYEGLCVLADKKDVGIRRIEDVLRELLASIDYASPPEMKDGAEWLEGFANNFAHRSAQRHIARELAPIIRKLGK